jgi:hypothetical protein
MNILYWFVQNPIWLFLLCGVALWVAQYISRKPK